MKKCVYSSSAQHVSPHAFFKDSHQRFDISTCTRLCVFVCVHVFVSVYLRAWPKHWAKALKSYFIHCYASK